MSDVFLKNCSFIREKYALLENLTDSLYCDIARTYYHKNSAQPSPEEIALLYEEIHATGSGVTPSPDFAGFCRAFSEVYGGRLTNWSEPDTETASPKIAYLQNTFSDRAYRQFSAQFERVSAAYYPGFREVCEEVYNGGCQYAMLPVYNTRDGQLISFRRLILKYDLKISLVTDVETSDDSVMRFALLQKGIDSRMTKEPRYLDLSVVLENTDYATFLSACESLGAVVLMMQSLPLEYADDLHGLTLQFDIQNASRDALFFFLEGSHIRYDTVGIFDII